MVYADNAATTRISDNAFEKMLPFLREQYGNASSQYSLGTKSKRAITHARKQIADAIGASPSEIIFTSGGTEANTWVLRDVAESFRGERIHFVTSSIEHPSIMNMCRVLENHGVELSYLPVDNKGRISILELETAIKPNTKLVSIMLANNEIGTVQPVSKIGQLIKNRGILFHTDAVQAVGHIPVDVKALNVDYLTASAHKFYGAKGTGVLYIRSGLSISPQIFGGKQEGGFRAGTENVAGIVAAGYAIEESTRTLSEKEKRVRSMVQATMTGIKEKIPSVKINSDTDYCLPGILNLGFDCISGESLMHLLDMKGVCVSTSSACSSGEDEPSHVLIALGQSEQQAKSAIRISYGRYNTLSDVKTIVDAVVSAYLKISKSINKAIKQ